MMNDCSVRTERSLWTAALQASEKVFERLKARGERVSFAESLTGGLIAACFISNSGASTAIDESYVTYAADSKIRILGVSPETVRTVGVVSERCACEMAAGVRKISGASWGVSATGLAGPDGGTDALPVGSVFIGIAGSQGAAAYEYHFDGERTQVRIQAVQAAFERLLAALNADE